VWFFVLRGPSTSGDEFLGTWTASEGGIGAATIVRTGGDFKVTLTGAKPEEALTVPARIDGKELVITTDDLAATAGEKADEFKKMLEAVAGDFRLVFASVDPTHLQMRIEGASDDLEEADSTTTLVKSSQ